MVEVDLEVHVRFRLVLHVQIHEANPQWLPEALVRITDDDPNDAGLELAFAGQEAVVVRRDDLSAGQQVDPVTWEPAQVEGAIARETGSSPLLDGRPRRHVANTARRLISSTTWIHCPAAAAASPRPTGMSLNARAPPDEDAT